MIYRLLVAALLLCCTFASYAQLELSASTFTDRYVDELKHIYKPGHTSLFSFGVSGREKDTRFGISCNLGYGVYTPKADTFYTYARNEILGYQSYSHYQVYHLTLTLRYGFILHRHFEPYIGLETGYGITRYSYSIHGPRGDDEDQVADVRRLMIPFVGINIPFGRLCFFAQTQYTLSTSESPHFKKDDFNFIWSNGVGVRYRVDKSSE